jgi:hypothetical protein
MRVSQDWMQLWDVGAVCGMGGVLVRGEGRVLGSGARRLVSPQETGMSRLVHEGRCHRMNGSGSSWSQGRPARWTTLAARDLAPNEALGCSGARQLALTLGLSEPNAFLSGLLALPSHLSSNYSGNASALHDRLSPTHSKRFGRLERESM